jgi:alpha-L-fucosidase
MVKSARLLPAGKQVEFEQDRFRVKFSGLPKAAPEKLATVLELECASVPKQDMDFVRRRKPRGSV